MMSRGGNIRTSSSSGALDSSFQLELVDVTSITLGRNSDDERIGPERMPCVVAILEELRRTDNILVTEIGERGLRDYLEDELMATTSNSSFCGDDNDCDVESDHPLCDWEFQDEESFRYIMEILQANMIYFLKRRYFDLERYREKKFHQNDRRSRCGSSSSSIAEDFQTVFDKALSSRYLANREKVAFRCFQKPYQLKGNGGMLPKNIQRALVRLHRRAGIYLPEEGRSHPAPTDHNRFEEGIDAYWIDLWWLCSSLLVWIIEPCVEITLSQENIHYNKKRRLDVPTTNKQNAAGFAKQSQPIAKIPFDLIQRHTQRLELFYDKVLLHDGPWDENEPDEDYVINNFKGDNEEDGYSDECADDEVGNGSNGTSIAAKGLGEASGSKGNETTQNIAAANEQNHGEGGIYSSIGNERIENPIANEQGKGTTGEWKNHRRLPSAGSITRSYGDDCEAMADMKIKAVCDSFWGTENDVFI